MALIKGMTEKEYARQYYLDHRKPPNIKLCEHGFQVSKCAICKVIKRKAYYEAHRNSEAAKKAYRVEHPLRYDACSICGDTFLARDYRSITCNKAECKKTYRNNYERAFREEVRSHYGTFCAVCGGTCGLELDHKYGYGRHHRIEVVHSPTASNTFYQWLKRNNYPTDYTVNGVTYKDGFRVLCKKCNNGHKRYHYNVGHEVSEEQRKKISQTLKAYHL